MAHTITERPNSICFSKNEIRYRYTLDDLSRAGLYFEVKLWYKYEGGTYAIYTTEKLKPTSDGVVTFYLQQYIDSLLKPDFRDASLLNVADKQWVYFYIDTREVWDEDTTTEFTTHEEGNERLAILAGIEKHRYGRNNFFINYFDVRKPFLTWIPTNRFIFINQPVFLSVLIKAGSTANLAIKVDWKATDGTIGDFTENLDEEAGYIFHLNVHADILGLTSVLAGKKLYYYDVSIINTATDAVVIDAYRFYINYDYFYNYYDLIYFNSFRGIDTIRVRGEVVEGIDRQYDDADGGFGSSEWNAIIKSAENKQVGIVGRKYYKGDIGYLNNKKEQQVLAEMLLSPYILQKIDSRFVPLLCMSKSKDFRNSADTRWSFPIEWQLAETNEVFTPEWINLGTGTDTETY
jgi:hypothetical protein